MTGGSHLRQLPRKTFHRCRAVVSRRSAQTPFTPANALIGTSWTHFGLWTLRAINVI